MQVRQFYLIYSLSIKFITCYFTNKYTLSTFLCLLMVFSYSHIPNNVALKTSKISAPISWVNKSCWFHFQLVSWIHSSFPFSFSPSCSGTLFTLEFHTLPDSLQSFPSRSSWTHLEDQSYHASMLCFSSSWNLHGIQFSTKETFKLIFS
jgi:hypothetical protein